MAAVMAPGQNYEVESCAPLLETFRPAISDIMRI
jgi:hypothetical protein